MKSITLTEFKEMVRKAITDNNITDVEKFVVQFSTWDKGTDELPRFYVCLYCKKVERVDKNISTAAENPEQAISDLIFEYKNFDTEPVEQICN